MNAETSGYFLPCAPVEPFTAQVTLTHSNSVLQGASLSDTRPGCARCTARLTVHFHVSLTRARGAAFLTAAANLNDFMKLQVKVRRFIASQGCLDSHADSHVARNRGIGGPQHHKTSGAI